MVKYGKSATDWASYGSTKIDGEMTTSHRVTLTGLTPVTQYHFRVGSTDAHNNGPENNPNGTNPSGDNILSTGADPDTTAPQITSAISVNSITKNTAVVQWQTNELSNSIVKYDTGTQNWGSYYFSKSDAPMVANHSVTLTGLTESTLYYVRVGSVDAYGNGPDPSEEVTFSTTADDDLVAPQIISAITVTSITGSSALVQWQTDELSNSMVHYGADSADWGSYDETRSDGFMVTNHTVVLTGLASNTEYHLSLIHI